MDDFRDLVFSTLPRVVSVILCKDIELSKFISPTILPAPPSSVPLFYVLRWKRVSRLLMSPCVEVREWVHQNWRRVQLEGMLCSIFGSAVPLAMFCYPFQKPFRPESVEMIIHFLLISLFLSTISDHLEVPLHSDLQLDVHLLPLHLGSCLSRLWPAHHSARGHGKVFSRGKWVGEPGYLKKDEFVTGGLAKH